MRLHRSTAVVAVVMLVLVAVTGCKSKKSALDIGSASPSPTASATESLGSDSPSPSATSAAVRASVTPTPVASPTPATSSVAITPKASPRATATVTATPTPKPSPKPSPTPVKTYPPGSIDIRNHNYNGKMGAGQVALTVGPGATVNVTNQDLVNHTVTGSGFDAHVGGGGSTSFKAPSSPGSYSFVCTIHSDMAATLVVKA